MTLGLGCFLLMSPLYAALKPGGSSARLHNRGDACREAFTFSLADALKNGPVVLYFYPAAFTKGCTVEAHEFAEATDKFKAMGATVIVCRTMTSTHSTVLGERMPQQIRGGVGCR